MNNIGKVAENYKDKFPAFPSYLQCQSRAFMYGLSGFTISSGWSPGSRNFLSWLAALGLQYEFSKEAAKRFALVYFMQELNKKHVPYPSKYFIMPAAIVASIAGWTVTRNRTQNCQRMWMAAEGKHSALSHYDEKPVLSGFKP